MVIWPDFHFCEENEWNESHKLNWFSIVLQMCICRNVLVLVPIFLLNNRKSRTVRRFPWTNFFDPFGAFPARLGSLKTPLLKSWNALDPWSQVFQIDQESVVVFSDRLRQFDQESLSALKDKRNPERVIHSQYELLLQCTIPLNRGNKGILNLYWSVILS